MTPWFFQDDARVSSERTAIAVLDERATWLKGPTWTLSGSNLAVQADIQVGEVDYQVVLEYPALFPAAPPTVSPRDSSDRWSDHQYLGSGELCIEWGPDNWEPHITGADLLESAYRLLSTEKGDGDEQQRIVASRHESTLGQDLRGVYQRVAISPECEDFLGGLQEGTTGTFEFRVVHRDGNATLHIQSIHPDGLEIWNAPALPKTVFIARGFCHKGWFARTGLNDDSFGGTPYGALKDTLEGCGCVGALPPADADRIFSILLLRNNSADVRVLMLPDKDGETVTQLRTFRASAGDGSRTGPDGDVFVGKRVGIVGLGSAGSKTALTLGRSGVRDFLLVDDDIFLPENIERHTLDYRNVGEHKVNGVKGQLEALTADMKVEIAQLRLSGQEASSSVSYQLKQLSECDVVVDATSNPRTFNELAETVKQAGTPMVWFEVFAGGIGGFIARYRPGKDPDPFTARARFHSYLEDKEPAPGASTEPYAGEAADGEPLIATDAEVGIIAHHAARLASDILEERQPSTFPNSLYLIGLERGWLFEAPFHTIGLDIGEPTEASAGKAGSLSQENIDFLGEVIKRGVGEDRD